MKVDTLCKIRNINRTISEFEVQFMNEHHLSLNEAMLLCTLTQNDGMTASAIAQELGLTCSNTSKVINLLEKKGFIFRSLGQQDKRMMVINLKPEGLEKIESLKRQVTEMPKMLEEILEK